MQFSSLAVSLLAAFSPITRAFQTPHHSKQSNHYGLSRLTPSPLMREAPSKSSRLSMSFVQTDSVDIPSLSTRLDTYEDTDTGAKHYHIPATEGSKEKAFSILLKTLPTDSTGVAHILEHTVLAGSQQYPVKDPFFSMLKRSLNTFLNAMTSSDWTQYPFATNNEKDFFNLMSVYQDAVFFPLLEPEAFAQEGHRLEFQPPTNSSSALQFSGVVYNEMKGMMSSVSYDIAQRLQSYLFPKTTYYHNSGGNPRDIPDLSYEQFVQFHQKHYHPSNAAFLTYGDIPAEKIQAKIQNDVLSKFKEPSDQITVPQEQKQLSPKKVTEYYPLDMDQINDKTFHLIGWVLEPTGDIQSRLESQFLSQVLLGNGAAPLQKFLDQYPHGVAASAFNGLDTSAIQMQFVCGIEGSNPEHAEDFKEALFAALEEIALQGVPLDTLESVHHQLELSQREIKGGRFPVGLSLLNKLVPAFVYNADPKKMLSVNQELAKLKQNIQDPNYIKSLVKKLLLTNTHRVQLTAIPDTGLNKAIVAQEKKALEEIQSQLTDQQKEAIVEKSQALEDRQNKADDHSLLPILDQSDIPIVISTPKASLQTKETATVLRNGRSQFSPPSATLYQTKTNGISYVNAFIPMPELSEQEKQVFPLFETMVTKLGVGDRDYLQNQAEQSAVSGGLSAFSDLQASTDSLNQHLGYFGIGAKALNHNVNKTLSLIDQTIDSARFDEKQRIRTLITKIRSQMEMGISFRGQHYAMLASASHHSPVVHYKHKTEGLASLLNLKSLEKAIDDEKEMTSLQLLLNGIHDKLKHSPRFNLGVSDACDQALLASLTPPSKDNYASRPFRHTPTLTPGNQIWVTNTQVNHCAKSYSGVPEHHPDAASLKVLSAVLSLEFLHNAIRETGAAYGGGAKYDHSSGVFSFYSYRDPRNIETLKDFDRSIDWVLKAPITEEMLTQAKLFTIGQLDKTGTPASDATSSFCLELQGRDEQSINAFRQQVLDVNESDLKEVARTYLHNQEASTAVITSEQGFKAITNQSPIRYDRLDLV